MTLLKCQYIYWKGFNIFVRIMGVIWLSGGGIGLFQTILLLPPQKTIDVNGLPSNDLGIKFIAILMCVVALVAGFFMLKLKAYYPKKIQDWLKQNTANI